VKLLGLLLGGAISAVVHFYPMTLHHCRNNIERAFQVTSVDQVVEIAGF
jgi:hypothetical protein